MINLSIGNVSALKAMHFHRSSPQTLPWKATWFNCTLNCSLICDNFQEQLS